MSDMQDVAFVEEAEKQFALDEQRARSDQFERMHGLGYRLLAEFGQAEQDRRETEERWLRDLRQYRGIYEPEVEAELAGRSKAFTRKTRVKVKTADARMFDLLFPASSERNYAVDSTPVPKVPRAEVQKIAAGVEQALGAPPTSNDLTAAVKKWVADRAKKMGDVIEDQLIEGKYRKLAKKVLHSGHVYGTGVLKGPLVERKTRTRYAQDRSGKWAARSEKYATPFLDFVPLWRWYPDMAATEVEHCRYAYELHRFTKHQMQGLSQRKSFNGEAIKAHLLANPRGATEKRYHDLELRMIGERMALNDLNSGLYDVIERWGWLDAEDLREAGIEVPPERAHESFFGNVWVLPQGQVIKAMLQPMSSMAELYHLYQFDKDETSIFGDGVCSIMRDDQEMLNAATRMILDNGAITAGPQLEVNVRALSALTDPTRMSPFKIWLRTGEDGGQHPAVRAINLDSHLNELVQIKEVFDSNTDEVTAIPRYMSGENATEGAAGTASGMSMLMGMSALTFKDLVASYDEDVTKPFVGGMYTWNMRYNPREDIKGDFDVQATGAASLVAKEVRSQQLAVFCQTLQPEERPYMKWYAFLRERIRSTEIGESVLKDESEVEEYENSEEYRRQQQLAQAQQELSVALLEKQVAKLGAEVAKLNAGAVETKVNAAYSAMQAGGVAATNPAAAAGGDEILKSAGWVDATPQDTTTLAVEEGAQAAAAQPSSAPAPAQPQPPPAIVDDRLGSLMGHQRGIQTPEIEQ